MEQKINGNYVDLEGMELDQLELWAEACEVALSKAREDLSIVESEIASRHFLNVQPPHGDPL